MSRCHALDEYLDRAGLEAELPERLTAHLTRCEVCSGRWRHLSSAEAGLRTINCEPVPPAPSLSLDFVRARRTHVRPSGRWRLAVAGAVCLAALVVWHLRGPSGALVSPEAPHRRPGRVAVPPRLGTQQLTVLPGPRRPVVLPPRIDVAQSPAAAVTKLRHHPRRYLVPPRRLAPAGVASSSPLDRYRGDDFVTVPRPVMAAVMSPASMHVVVEAMDEYRRARSVVDPRLAKLVTPGGAPRLGLLLRRLSDATGAAMSLEPDLRPLEPPAVGPSLPARDLMGRIAREMSLEWRRSGSPGAYAYRLVRAPEERDRLMLQNREQREARVTELFNSLNTYLSHQDSTAEELRSEAASLGARHAEQPDPFLVDQRAILLWLAEDPGSRLAAQLLGRLEGSQYQALRRGEAVQLPSGTLGITRDGSTLQLYAEVAGPDGKRRRIALSRVEGKTDEVRRRGGVE